MTMSKEYMDGCGNARRPQSRAAPGSSAGGRGVRAASGASPQACRNLTGSEHDVHDLRGHGFLRRRNEHFHSDPIAQGVRMNKQAPKRWLKLTALFSGSRDGWCLSVWVSRLHVPARAVGAVGGLSAPLPPDRPAAGARGAHRWRVLPQRLPACRVDSRARRRSCSPPW